MATHAQRTDQSEQPDRALAEPDAITVLPGDEFNRLLEWLEEPPEVIPWLQRAAARHRKHPTFIDED